MGWRAGRCGGQSEKPELQFTVWIQFYSLYYTPVTQPPNIYFSSLFNEDKHMFLALKYMFTKY